MKNQELEVVPTATTALTIAVKGEVLSSNFVDYEKFVIARVESVNVNLKTPEDVEQGKLDSKELKAFVADLDEKANNAYKEMNQVYMLMQGIKRLKGSADEKRIAIDRKVKEISAKIKQDLIDAGIAKLELNTLWFQQAIAEATKRKSSPLKMSEAIDEVVESINLGVLNNKKAIADCKEKHGDSIGYDNLKLLCMTPEMLVVELERRIERQAQAVEKAKLQAKLDAEKIAKDEAEAIARQNERDMFKPSEGINKTSSEIVDTPSVKAPEPEIETVQAKTENETAEQEMARFMDVVPSAFAPVKAARSALKHPENIDAAGEFAQSLGAAWNKLKTPTK